MLPKVDDEKGNIVPTAGIEPTSLAFYASVLTITPPSLADVNTLQTHTCLCGSMPDRSVQTTSLVSLELQVF